MAEKKRRKPTNTTVSFRIPVDAQSACIGLAVDATRERGGPIVPVSEIYNLALGKYLADNGTHIPGWNAPEEAQS